MSLDGQWRTIESELPGDWERAQVRVALRDRAAADDAAALLAPMGPYRSDPTSLRVEVTRDGSGTSPEGFMRLLRRLRHGVLVLEGSEIGDAPVRAAERSLVDAWDRAFAHLPSDWSDALVEITFTSTDFIERAVVLCVQMNPRRDGARTAFRIRCARLAGYGVAPGMARRCLERCAAEAITGDVSVLRVLSDTHHVGTQGPTWQIQGQTV